MTLELPWPPSVNHYWTTARNGRRYISVEGQRFREDVKGVVWDRMIKPIAGPLKVEIAAFPPDNRRRDIDNLLKSTLDALQHAGVYADDYQIADLRIVRQEAIDGGCVVVTVEKIIQKDC